MKAVLKSLMVVSIGLTTGVQVAIASHEFNQPSSASGNVAVSQLQISGADHNNTLATCTGTYSGAIPAEELVDASCQIISGPGAVTYEGFLYVTIYSGDPVFPWVCSGVSLRTMSCNRNSGPSGG